MEKEQVIGQRTSGRRRGLIVGGALVLSVATGGWWASLGQPATTVHEASACQPVFAGRAGMVPCKTWNDPEDRMARQIVGTTVTGATLGFAGGGGPIGAGLGALGGLLSNISWSDL